MSFLILIENLIAVEVEKLIMFFFAIITISSGEGKESYQDNFSSILNSDQKGGGKHQLVRNLLQIVGKVFQKDQENLGMIPWSHLKNGTYHYDEK